MWLLFVENIITKEHWYLNEFLINHLISPHNFNSDMKTKWNISVPDKKNSGIHMYLSAIRMVEKVKLNIWAIIYISSVVMRISFVVMRSISYRMRNSFAALPSSSEVIRSTSEIMSKSSEILRSSSAVMRNSSEILCSSSAVMRNSSEVSCSSSEVMRNSPAVMRSSPEILCNSSEIT